MGFGFFYISACFFVLFFFLCGQVDFATIEINHTALLRLKEEEIAMLKSNIQLLLKRPPAAPRSADRRKRWSVEF